jgi:hypothetical protein
MTGMIVLTVIVTSFIATIVAAYIIFMNRREAAEAQRAGRRSGEPTKRAD